MDRALPGDLEKFRPLLVTQLPYKLNVQLDPVNLPLFSFTFGAVDGMDPRMPKASSDAFEWPAFTPRVQRYGHRRACAQGRE
jgi:hypothetical protein